MPSSLLQLRKRREAKSKLAKFFDNSDVSLVVHYACESFFKSEDGSPRISCISVRHLGSGHANSFSAYHISEEMGISADRIWEHYDKIEKALMDAFFEFCQRHQGYTWGHWNMRSLNFGFQALEHRHRVLGGNPIVLPDSRKLDIASLMVDIYGVEYCSKPVLANLCRMNGIFSEFFLEGSDEATAFEQGQLRQIYQSNLKKVDFISYVSELALTEKLKTNSSWWRIHGIHPKILIELIKEHWIFSLLGALALLFSLARALSLIGNTTP